MTNKPFILAFATATIGASLGVVGCSSSSGHTTPAATPTIDQANVNRAPPSAADLGTAVTANNTFALKLYGQVAPSATGNVMTSPLSASLALTMTYAGAQGQTQTEMASVLGIDPNAGSIFDAQNALTQALAGRAASAFSVAQEEAKSGETTTAPAASDYTFQVVNSVWGEKTYPWASPFLNILAASYGTGVYLEDFINAPSAVEVAVNDWVSTQTDNAINNLLPPNAIRSDSRMVLVNAIDLKLPWQTPFDPAATANGPFTRGNGNIVTANFMHDTFTTSSYVETAEAQVVSLPLADNQLSVVFALPKNGLANLVAALTPATWSAMTTPATMETNVALTLPKFDFTSATQSLVAPLKALGMTTAFDPQLADFKGLCAVTPDGETLYISDVLQKAMMGISETGVHAAAATAVILGDAGVEWGGTSVTMTIDQPFLVSIVDQSGAIVFLGQIDDPTNGGSL